MNAKDIDPFHFKLTRMKQGLTQLDVSKALGVRENVVCNFETGRSSIIHRMKAKRLAEVLGVSVSDLLGGGDA